MKNKLLKLNQWYDNLPLPIRFLYFLIFIAIPLAVTSYLSETEMAPLAFPVFVLLVMFIRFYPQFKTI